MSTKDNSDAVNIHSDHSVEKLNKLIPLSPSGARLLWKDGNDAKLTGIIHYVKKYWKKHHLFSDFFKHRAVPVGRSLAIDSKNAVIFIESRGGVTDKRGYDDRCPPTGQRIREHPAHSPTSSKFKALGDTDAIASHYMVAPHILEAKTLASSSL